MLYTEVLQSDKFKYDSFFTNVLYLFVHVGGDADDDNDGTVLIRTAHINI